MQGATAVESETFLRWDKWRGSDNKTFELFDSNSNKEGEVEKFNHFRYKKDFSDASLKLKFIFKLKFV